MRATEKRRDSLVWKRIVRAKCVFTLARGGGGTGKEEEDRQAESRKIPNQTRETTRERERAREAPVPFATVARGAKRGGQQGEQKGNETMLRGGRGQAA